MWTRNMLYRNLVKTSNTIEQFIQYLSNITNRERFSPTRSPHSFLEHNLSIAASYYDGAFLRLRT